MGKMIRNYSEIVLAMTGFKVGLGRVGSCWLVECYCVFLAGFGKV